MEGADMVADAYVQAAGVPLIKGRDMTTRGTAVWGFRIPNPVILARDTSTTACSSTDANLCEKPVGGNLGVIIACSVAIPLVIALGALFYLHRRVVRRQRLEDATDPHKSLDFGLDINPGKGGKRKSMMPGEKDTRSRYNRQMSMDMNLSSPYLLPPELHNSRESLNSLARTLHNNEDPYRPINNYGGSDAASLRSMEKGGRASNFTGSTYGRDPSRPHRSGTMDTNGSGSQPSRQNSLPPKSPLSPVDPFMASFKEEMVSPVSPTPPPPAYKETFTGHPEPIIPEVGIVEEPEREQPWQPSMPSIQEPAPVAQRIARKPPPSLPAQSSPADSAVDIRYNDSAFETNQHSDVNVGQAQSSGQLSPPQIKSLPASPRPAQNQSVPEFQMPIVEEPQEDPYRDYARMPNIPEPQAAEFVDEDRGRNMQRQSHLYDQQNGGLNVPQQNNKRLSVGFRPLPPDEIMETEDPEYRANRIRSFYKEYFEESRAEPLPPMPQQSHAVNYYEDYDSNYLGDATYFDPETNAFVMPYAQPVARRAMTPPPSGQRFPGPRGGPRPFHGSMGGMHVPGVRGPPPRPGSSASNRMPGRPRAGSTMSGGRFGGPRKPMPPPVALNTLPTPSKLKDDSFALMGAIDFAPPDSFAERAQMGRSQSPMGERRPYKPSVPVASPLVTAFDDLAALPSPHLLRKSGTFTALDFAPPRKFADPNDARSETGSIRSNRSGISAVQLSAIRSGAGRISRLPGDTVFTQVALQEQLKPQWGMRP